MDRLVAWRAVADTGDAHLPEQRHDRPAVDALVSQAQQPVRARHHDRLADVAVATGVDVRLQAQPDQLAAAAL